MAREQFQTLTEPMYYILLALLDECCGVDIMEKVQNLSHDRVHVGPGTLYAMLSKFEENGVIRMTGQEGRRKSYVITDRGKAAGGIPTAENHDGGWELDTGTGGMDVRQLPSGRESPGKLQELSAYRSAGPLGESVQHPGFCRSLSCCL